MKTSLHCAKKYNILIGDAEGLCQQKLEFESLLLDLGVGLPDNLDSSYEVCPEEFKQALRKLESMSDENYAAYGFADERYQVVSLMNDILSEYDRSNDVMLLCWS